MKNTPITEHESNVLADLLKRAIACGQLEICLKSPYENPADAKKDGWTWNDRHDGNACSSDAWVLEHGMAEGDHVLGHDDNDQPIWSDEPLATLSLYVSESDLESILGCPAN